MASRGLLLLLSLLLLLLVPLSLLSQLSLLWAVGCTLAEGGEEGGVG
jgi:hypothetical protein